MAATAHQIARTAVQFGVSEIIVYDTAKPSREESAPVVVAQELEKPKKIVFGEDSSDEPQPSTEDKSTPITNDDDAELSDQDKLVGLLEYFVTPSYLRKSLFGDRTHFFDSIAKKLPKLPGLDLLNHENSRYFIGLSVNRKVRKSKTRTITSSNGRKRKRKTKVTGSAEENDPGLTGYVNIGEKKVLKLAGKVKVPVHSIVVIDKETKAVVSPEDAFGNDKKLEQLQKKGIETSDTHWTTVGFGYKVRKVENFGQVFTECPYSGGYRYTAFAPCAEFLEQQNKATGANEIALIEEETFLIKGITTTPGDDVPVLLITGKWKELEQAVLADSVNFAGLEKAQMLFDGRIRMGRGARVEDAVLIAMSKIEGL